MIKLAPPAVQTIVRAAVGAVLAAGLLALPVASPAASQDPNQPKPGYWKYNYHVSIIPAGNEMKCLSKAEVARFFDGICNHGYTCDYPIKDVHDGKVKLGGTWLDRKGRLTKINADGIYDSDSFHLNAHVNLGALLGLPASGTIDGKFVSDTCPPGSENPKKKS